MQFYSDKYIKVMGNIMMMCWLSCVIYLWPLPPEQTQNFIEGASDSYPITYTKGEHSESTEKDIDEANANMQNYVDNPGLVSNYFWREWIIQLFIVVIGTLLSYAYRFKPRLAGSFICLLCICFMWRYSAPIQVLSMIWSGGNLDSSLSILSILSKHPVAYASILHSDLLLPFIFCVFFIQYVFVIIPRRNTLSNLSSAESTNEK